MSDQDIENEIRAKGADVAPRVTPQMLEDVIAGEYYLKGSDAYAFAPMPSDHFGSLGLLTVCFLVLKNGFTVTGESACASPENFNAEVGRKVAREHAKQKLWPLLRYELKERLHVQSQLEVARNPVGTAEPAETWFDRLLTERDQNEARINKLGEFLLKEVSSATVHGEAKLLLERQLAVMIELSAILHRRITLIDTGSIPESKIGDGPAGVIG